MNRSTFASICFFALFNHAHGATFSEPVLYSKSDGFGYVVESSAGFEIAEKYCKLKGYDSVLEISDLNFCENPSHCQATNGWILEHGKWKFSSHVTQYFNLISCEVDSSKPAIEPPKRGQRHFSAVKLRATDGRDLVVSGADLGLSALHACKQLGYTSLVSFTTAQTCSSSSNQCPYSTGFYWQNGGWKFNERVFEHLNDLVCMNH
jgi:hypothetical protein